MSTATRRPTEERFSARFPIWIRLPVKALAVLLVILIPSMYISSLQPTGILAIFTGIATMTLVMMVVVAFVPVGFAVMIAARRLIGVVKAGVGMAIGP